MQVAANVKVQSKIRIEVCANNGQAYPVKALVVNLENCSWEKIKKQCCGKIGSKASVACKIFDGRGQIVQLESLVEGKRLFVSADGSPFIPMALKQTAAEKREVKRQALLNDPTARASSLNGTLAGMHKLPSGVSEIVFGIFIGSGRDGRDEQQIGRFHTILNCAKDWPALSKRPENVITYLHLPLLDQPTSMLASFLPPIFSVLDAAKGQVLVHCIKGSSRSPAIVAAYLIARRGYSALGAVKLLCERRDSVCINPGFLLDLLAIESEYERGCSSIIDLLRVQDIDAKRFLDKFSTLQCDSEEASHLFEGKRYLVASCIQFVLNDLIIHSSEPVNILKMTTPLYKNFVPAVSVAESKKGLCLHVLSYLQSQSNGSKAAHEMARAFGLKVSRHETYRQLFQFVYSATNSNLSHPLVSECRGIIVEYANGAWNAVAIPFFKFFNMGDARAGNFDWENFHVTEKLDGMFVFAYPYDGEWQIATQSVLDGSNCLSSGETVRQAFFRIAADQGLQLPPADNGELPMVYMFELLSPSVQVVVRIEAERLICLGARNMLTGAEIDAVSCCQSTGWLSAPRFSMSRLEAEEAARTMNGAQSEGFVLTDGRFNRLKLKAPSYISLGHLKGAGAQNGQLSPLQLTKIIVGGHDDEVVLAFPALGPRIGLYRAELQRLKETGAVSEEDDWGGLDKLALLLAETEAPSEREPVELTKKQRQELKAARKTIKKAQKGQKNQ